MALFGSILESEQLRMHLMVQIPCLNEEESLGAVLQEIPSEIEGFSLVTVVVVDDGSSDDTASVAAANGVDAVLTHRKTRGLAAAFRTGHQFFLQSGADVLVNIDGDHQYPPSRIVSLCAPILQGKADLTIGNRDPGSEPSFSRRKRALQRLGAFVVSRIAGQEVPDPGSGFRAFSRDALVSLNVTSKYSYTMELTLQAAFKGLKTEFVPLQKNPDTRPSRLFESESLHIIRSAEAILRATVMYAPWRLFGPLALLFGSFGLFPFVRFGVYRLLEMPADFIQSLLVGVVLLGSGFLTLAVGVIANLVKANRQLAEDLLCEVRMANRTTCESGIGRLR